MTKVIGLTISFILLFSAQVSAEDLFVYPNEYIVETRLSALGNSQIENTILDREGAKVLKNVGRKAKLVSPKYAKAALTTNADGVVPFNPNDEFCADLVKSGKVKHCSPNFQIKIDAVPNDTSFSQLWGLSTSSGINAPSAWDLSTGSNDVVVAIIDTGIDYNHQDLSQNIWVNPFEIAGNGIDDDNNGYVDDIHGISAVNNSGNPMDDNSHGTHVAGTIGAAANNAKGVAGINWNVKMMGLKFLDANGSGSLSNAITTIEYMTDMKQKGVNIVVSNNSWGGGGYSQALFNAIQDSINAGIVFAAAAGNSANDNDASASYPASYDIDGVVSVAAIDSDHNLASFSNYGLFSVDIAAPGVSILSTTPGNQYASFSGTSMATPHVAGSIALLAGYNSGLDKNSLITRLYETAVPDTSLTGLVYTGRRLDVSRMLRNQNSPVPSPEIPESSCEYNSSSVGYAPDYSADNKSIVLQADEFSFYTVNLPFNFPFYGEMINKLYLSPNGVIYTKAKPTSLDYKNSETAPVNSIAALHTDLISDANPRGVRVSTSANSVTIYWRAQHYSARANGDVHVRTTLYNNGVIKTFVDADDSTVLTAIKNSSTIGVKGNAIFDYSTHSYNSLSSDNTGIQFVPNCQESNLDSEINYIDGYTKRKGKNIDKAFPKKRLNINFSGVGTGILPVSVSLDGTVCESPISVSLVNGVGSVATKMPKYISKYRNITFSTAKASDVLRIKRSAADRKSSRSLSKTKKAKLAVRHCGKIVRKLGSL